MFNQSRTRLRDESAVQKWDQLKQYENNTENSNHQLEAHMEYKQYEQNNSLSMAKTFRQLKESSSRTYSSIKTHMTELYRKKKQQSQGSQMFRNASNFVSQNPNPEDGRGPMQTLGVLGSRIKNSKSLQSLEVVVEDNIRQMVDTATNMGESMKSKYGSRVELQNRNKYDKFRDEVDYDSDDDSRY